MKSKKVIQTMLSCIKDNDVVIFSGDELCKEAYEYYRDGNFYIRDNNCNGLSLALGIAMNTNKRVFVFCTDSDLIKNISYMLNIAVSKCKNIFVVVLVSGKYQESGGQVNIFDSISSPKNLLFSMGFLVFDYTFHLKNKGTVKELKQLIERSIGPVVSIIKVTGGLSNLESYNIPDNKLLIDRFKKFIQNKIIGTSLYKGS